MLSKYIDYILMQSLIAEFYNKYYKNKKDNILITAAVLKTVLQYIKILFKIFYILL